MTTTTVQTDAPTFDNRQDFADELINLARTNDRVVAVCNDFDADRRIARAARS